jgi:hypothetical protein
MSCLSLPFSDGFWKHVCEEDTTLQPMVKALDALRSEGKSDMSFLALYRKCWQR